jgi:hypothetical protein
MPVEAVIIGSGSSISPKMVVFEPILNTKRCSNCHITKNLAEFSKDESLPDGLNRTCRNCYRIHQKLQRVKYKLPIECFTCKTNFIPSKHFKKYCCEKCSVEGKANTKIKNLQLTKEYRLRKARMYRRLHPNYMKEYWKTHVLQRKINDKRRRLKLKNIIKYGVIGILENLRKNLRKILKNYTGKHNTFKLIGCSKEFFIKYYESKFTEGMSWDKVMNGEIHCDHIRPCCSYDLSKTIEQSKCFHYTNLQPLWAEDNLRKGGRYGTS